MTNREFKRYKAHQNWLEDKRPFAEMAVAAPDDAACDGWAWFAAFLLGAGLGFIVGFQIAMWALAPEVVS